MASSKVLVAFLFLMGFVSAAQAQQAAQGFAVERFYPTGPGGGWFVMDDLDITGRLGGTLSLTTDYAAHPLVVTSPDGRERLLLVSNEAYLNVGLAVTYDRYRGYFYFPVPLVMSGNSGTVRGYQFAGPAFTVGGNPDTLSDPVMGFDIRLFGKPGDRLRLGASAQLIFPSGNRSDYDTDGTYRGILRFLAAGDSGPFSYAGQLGLQARSLNNLSVLGGPDGNEFLFGASGGRKFAVSNKWSLVLGPEVFGESAFNSFYALQQTGVEGLLTTRLEHSDKRRVRLKVGIGHGIVQHFGAPEWRIIVGVEVSGETPYHRN